MPNKKIHDWVTTKGERLPNYYFKIASDMLILDEETFKGYRYALDTEQDIEKDA